MRRSQSSELAERINITRTMMKKYSSSEEVVKGLMEDYGVSRRQAYRYIEESQKIKQKLPIPEEKIVFTVKLPKSIVTRIREAANTSGESLSSIVTKALKSFLKKKGYG